MEEEQGTAKAYEPGVATIIVKLADVGAEGGTRGRLSVDPDPLPLSKGKGHRATWRIQGGEEFNIEFDKESPFDRQKYDEKTAKSLPPRKDARLGAYKYTVTVPNCDPLDPEVIVGS